MALSKHSSSLLPELEEDILYKIPIESLLRFKSTCKQWYALFNETRFIYKHFDLSQQSFIQIDHKSVQIFNPVTQALLRLPIPHEFTIPSTISSMIHCNGLLLCMCIERGKCGNRNLAVWNPFLSRVKWIEPSHSYKMFDVYGFGYHNTSRDNYKILRFYVKSGMEDKSEVEIYEFKSKLWRSVDATLDSSVRTQNQAVSMNGNMYWIARRNKSNSEIEIFIQSFDFSLETFKLICHVPFEAGFTPMICDHIVLSGLRGDRLSLLHQPKNVEIEVWVTNKVTDGVVSWSKYFKVTRPDLPILHSSFHRNVPTYFIHKTNSIMLWCEEFDVKKNSEYVNVYEIGEGETKKQVERGQHGLCDSLHYPCYVYVPSLVPVPE